MREEREDFHPRLADMAGIRIPEGPLVVEGPSVSFILLPLSEQRSYLRLGSAGKESRLSRKDKSCKI